ncbi:MAG: hypothetical protein QXU65_06670 [Sulfolobales archaeon]
MALQHKSESSGVSRRVGRPLGLVALGLGVTSSALLGARSEDCLALVASGFLLALSINVLLVYRRYVDYYLIAASFLAVDLAYSLTMLAGVVQFYMDLVDLALIVLSLASVGYYWFLADVPSIFGVHTPIAVLVSTLMGIHFGLRYPVRLPLLTVIDALASLVSSPSSTSRAESGTATALFFMLFYLSPVVADVGVEALSMLAALYLARNLVLHSRLHQLRRGLGALVSLDMVLRPVLVALS